MKKFSAFNLQEPSIVEQLLENRPLKKEKA